MKVTTELKEKLNLIRTELEDELVREKVVIEECEGVELNALDEGGVSLLFRIRKTMTKLKTLKTMKI